MRLYPCPPRDPSPFPVRFADPRLELPVYLQADHLGQVHEGLDPAELAARVARIDDRIDTRPSRVSSRDTRPATTCAGDPTHQVPSCTA